MGDLGDTDVQEEVVVRLARPGAVVAGWYDASFARFQCQPLTCGALTMRVHESVCWVKPVIKGRRFPQLSEDSKWALEGGYRMLCGLQTFLDVWTQKCSATRAEKECEGGGGAQCRTDVGACMELADLGSLACCCAEGSSSSSSVRQFAALPSVLAAAHGACRCVHARVPWLTLPEGPHIQGSGMELHAIAVAAIRLLDLLREQADDLASAMAEWGSVGADAPIAMHPLPLHSALRFLTVYWQAHEPANRAALGRLHARLCGIVGSFDYGVSYVRDDMSSGVKAKHVERPDLYVMPAQNKKKKPLPHGCDALLLPSIVPACVRALGALRGLMRRGMAKNNGLFMPWSGMPEVLLPVSSPTPSLIEAQALFRGFLYHASPYMLTRPRHEVEAVLGGDELTAADVARMYHLLLATHSAQAEASRRYFGQRRLALAMALHPRLGRHSPFRWLPLELLCSDILPLVRTPPDDRMEGQRPERVSHVH